MKVTFCRPISQYRKLAELEINIEEKSSESKKTIDLVSISQYKTLSIQGSDSHSCGQIIDSIRSISLQTSDVQKALSELCDIWDRWHLNDLRPGTRKQEEIIRENPGKGYEQNLQTLYVLGLDYDRGYKYGSAWLVEPLPDEVEKRIEELVAVFDEIKHITVWR